MQNSQSEVALADEVQHNTLPQTSIVLQYMKTAFLLYGHLRNLQRKSDMSIVWNTSPTAKEARLRF